MLTSLPTSEATYVLAAIALVSGLVSFLSPYVQKLPGMNEQTLYANTLRALSFALNFLAVIGSEATAGHLDWHNWLAYVVTAAGGAIGAHVLYALHASSSAARTSRLAMLTTVSAPVETGLNADKEGVA